MVIKWFIKAMNATKFGHSSITRVYFIGCWSSYSNFDEFIGDSGTGEDVGFFSTVFKLSDFIIFIQTFEL